MYGVSDGRIGSDQGGTDAVLATDCPRTSHGIIDADKAKPWNRSRVYGRPKDIRISQAVYITKRLANASNSSGKVPAYSWEVARR
jgi:hypothetical protein